MITGRKTVTIFLFVLFLINSLGIVIPAAKADPTTQVLEFSLPSDLTDWVKDEEAGYIYAVSSGANSLYFIRLSDFSIEKTLSVGSNPYYLALDGQFLHIALSGATTIKTVDLSTKLISDTTTTSVVPYSVAASSDYLFYGNRDGAVYKYDKTARTSSLLYSNFLFDSTALAFDESSQTLFVGNISSYGGIVAVNAATGAKLSEDIKDGMEIGGFSYSLKHIFLDDRYVYFGGHQFNKDNLSETTGTYKRAFDDYTYLESVILDITDSYVITTQGIFDKATFNPIVQFSSNKKFALLDSFGRVYLAGIANWYVDSKKIFRYDYIIPPTTTAQFSTDSYSIKSDQVFTDWSTTDNSPYIYAIVASTNELVIINKEDLSIKQKMFVGADPKEIKIFDNKAYVIFKGENHVTVIDLSADTITEASISKVTTKKYPLNVFPDYNYRILYYGGSPDGISVTSAVYTSVTDAVYYEKRTSIYIPSIYALNQDTGILYGVTGSQLYRYDSRTFNLLDNNNVENTSYNPSLFIDESNLYYGDRRLDANQTSIQYGTFPEKVIYARGSHVFGSGAVYDRDSLTKVSDLYLSANKVYVSPDHSIFILTDKRLYKFGSVTEIQTIMNESRKPANVQFIDKDMITGRFNGYLTFKPPTDQEGITGYSAYFLDQSGNQLKQLGIFKKVDLSTDNLFVFEIDDTSIPAGTLNIGLYPLVRDKNGNTRTLGVTIVPLYDSPNYLPKDFSVTDVNSNINIFAGTVTWSAGNSEIPGVRYYIYFIDKQGAVGDELANVNGGRPTYSVTIPEKNVPEEVIGIGLFLANDDFISPFYSMKLLEDKRTPSIPESSITIFKYLIQSDKIIVNNLAVGDVIRVYNEEQMVMIGGGIVAPNNNSITILIGNLGNPGTKLRITRQSINRGESTNTLVVVPPVTNDSGGNSGGGGGGIPGGGIPGGGTPSGGIPGSGMPGGGVPSGNTLSEPSTKIIDNKDGVLRSSTDVPSTYISSLINDPDFKSNPLIVVKADEKATVQSSQFQIDSTALASIDERSKDAVLILESTLGKLQLPVQALFTEISKDSDQKQKVVILIAKAADEYKTKLNAQITGSTSSTLGDPVEFEIMVEGSGSPRLLSNLTTFINHEIKFNVAKNEKTTYAGLTFDPIAQAYVPVPTTWEWKDGVLYVTMKRKGNSVYTVVQTDFVFNDLDSKNPYKDSILALANRMIINGYPDGSFKSASTVTRAEFATMLNRALGILPKNKATSSFSDVKTTDWYAPHVEAAVESGLISGYPDGTFRPNQEIKHQEITVMLVNALKYSGTDEDLTKNSSTQYPDQLPDWAKPSFAIAFNKGVLPVDGPFHFQTDKNAERQESALLLMQLLKILEFTNK
ncbi:S-layer homology domain-containing protein [Paenibacillus koleovorans]|uniref:S-layer homology domain-containing protein n=1 Tax=Paenibacillus koleovorans TaxID=121608 RepID=UPI000FD951C6|nr:S-layer homology domain-containing protein [Paenibacillus koleovorans]